MSPDSPMSALVKASKANNPFTHFIRRDLNLKPFKAPKEY